MKKDVRFSIRANKFMVAELKKAAFIAGMSLHDFILTRCLTPQDRKLIMDIEALKHGRF